MFYCAEHSAGKLCLDCAGRKREDERRQLEEEAARLIHEDYVRTAKKIQKEAQKTGCLRVALILVAPAVCVGVGLLAALLLDPGAAMTQIWFFGWSLLGAPISVIMAIRGVIKARNRWAMDRAVELSARKPQFDEFFADWQANRLKDQLMIGAGIAAAIVAAGALEGMGSFGSSDKQTQQKLDDLHSEVDRLRRKL